MAHYYDGRVDKAELETALMQQQQQHASLNTHMIAAAAAPTSSDQLVPTFKSQTTTATTIRHPMRLAHQQRQQRPCERWPNESSPWTRSGRARCSGERARTLRLVEASSDNTNTPTDCYTTLSATQRCLVTRLGFSVTFRFEVFIALIA